jgi:transcriptional regulator CtsR
MDKTNDLVTEYIKSLTNDQLKIIEIAKKQLGTSYDIKKSIGYLQFIKTKS